jgi:hypothetical protein
MRATIKETITEKILEILQMQAENAIDLLDIIFSDRYTSYRKARRSLHYGPPQFKSDWAEWYRKRRAFHALLQKLKNEGFIKKENPRKNSPWSITKLGLKRLAFIKNKKKERQNQPWKYQKETGSGLLIVSFDVPEKEREKRYWLRSALCSLDFKKIQQSVWAGTAKLPEEFITDLKAHKMLSYVHIFSVSQSGTISEKEVG